MKYAMLRETTTDPKSSHESSRLKIDLKFQVFLSLLQLYYFGYDELK